MLHEDSQCLGLSNTGRNDVIDLIRELIVVTILEVDVVRLQIVLGKPLVKLTIGLDSISCKDGRRVQVIVAAASEHEAHAAKQERGEQIYSFH